LACALKTKSLKVSWRENTLLIFEINQLMKFLIVIIISMTESGWIASFFFADAHFVYNSLAVKGLRGPGHPKSLIVNELAK